MKVETLLRTEIEQEIESLGKVELGSDLYKTMVESIGKLTDRLIELEKLDKEMTEKRIAREIETEFNVEQMSEEKKDRFNKNCISIAGIVIPTVITIWGALKSWEFEKEGTVTSVMGRGFISKLLPKK